MVRFQRISDLEEVRHWLTDDPAVYAASSDDFAPPLELWEPNSHPDIWYLRAEDEEGPITLFVLVPQNHICWEVHVAGARTGLPFGHRMLAATRVIADFTFRHTRCRRLVAAIPATNTLAVRCFRSSGFQMFGLNPKSVQRKGRLIDQVLLGVSEGQEKKCH